MKDKIVAGLLCFFLGGFGVHRFYLGENGRGILCIVLSVLCFLLSFVYVGLIGFLIYGIVLFVESILFWTMDSNRFNQLYNSAYYSGPQYNANAPGFYQPHQYPGAGYPQQNYPQQDYRQAYQAPAPRPVSSKPGSSEIRAQKLQELKNLRSAGVLSLDEYEKKKQKILNRY